MCTIVEHSRNLTRSLAQFLVLHNDDSHTSHSKILLSTSIDGIILLNINRTAEDIRRHIGNQGNVYIQIFANLRSIDGIVSSDVQIVSISRNTPSLWNEGIVGVSRRSHLYYLTKQFGLLHSFLSPNTSVQVGSFLNQEVVRNHAELQRSTATKEDY